MATLCLIQKLNNEDSRKFIHGVIDSLCEKEGPSFEQYAASVSLSEYAGLKSVISVSVKQISRGGLDRKKLTEAANKLEGVNDDISSLLAECVWVRRTELRDQLVRDSCSLSHSNLEDYDWETKLALSSDKLGSLQEPLLSLDLHLNEARERKTEHIELSLNELNQLVTSLESANKIVIQLRT